MSTIALFTISSALHAETRADVREEPFIQNIEKALGEEFDCFGSDFSSFGTHDSDIIFIRTGGTEGIFRSLGLKGNIKLLTSGESNSLAASMEILSYLRSSGQSGEIIHGTPAFCASRIRDHAAVSPAPSCYLKPLPPLDLGGMRLGVIGHPSDWLISSDINYDKVHRRLNAALTDIPIQELLDEVKLPAEEMKTFAGSEEILRALKVLIGRYRLDGLTLRCFDLLDRVHNTGCLALARLNAEGIPASCEGDIPALLTLGWNQKKKGCPGFQCNLSKIDGDELLFAHCTAPLTMLRSYRYDTHFESGIGTAIRGELELREVEITKISPDLESYVSIPGKIVSNQAQPNLCRTQIVVKAPGAAEYFLRSALANHHIVSYSK